MGAEGPCETLGIPRGRVRGSGGRVGAEGPGASWGLQGALGGPTGFLEDACRLRAPRRGLRVPEVAWGTRGVSVKGRGPSTETP